MKVKPANICLEITESLLASNYQEICRIAEGLRNRGLKIAIDDFGTGYSSLARIRELPADYIKIDKFFIDRLLVLKSEYAITGDIISMAHKLGSCVIAEGIEDERQLQYLKKHGCDRIQGYLIAKPLDKEVAIKLLTSQQRPGEDNNMEGKQD
jgi:EAL domain-containing protein (putative c-di-GMP-specific phosphodiesterase class I)